MAKSNQEPSEQLIEQLAEQINRWGLGLPAILFLEVTKPFSFIASQGLLVCQPLVSVFAQQPRMADYAELLADRSNLDRLVARLERDRFPRGHDGKEED